jgi:DNA polymerase-4
MNRVIFLVDMNAFFITCETTRNPSLAGLPAAVAGDPRQRSGIILAANYEARAFGVRTAMVLRDALKLCPGMLLVPPDHTFYEQKSREVMCLLSRYTPVMEQNSIDEAWLDMTGCEGLYGAPQQAAHTIMTEIREKLGLMCSIGIAPNKFLAKMASEMKKPMGITALQLADVPQRLWPLPVGSLYGVGRSTADKLAGLGIRTIGDLAAVAESFLLDRFGKMGRELHEHANGRDLAPVQSHERDDMKSIGRSTTLARDMTDLEQAKPILLELADDIGATARRHEKKGQTIHITLKYNDFTVITRQARVHPTCTTHEIYAAGCRLLEQHWNPKRPVRLIGISLSGFQMDCAAGQLSLFDLPGQEEGIDRHEKLDKTIDEIRGRYGTDCVTYGKLLRKKLGRNDHDNREGPASGTDPEQPELHHR